MTTPVLIALTIGCAFVVVLVMSMCKVSGDCSREEEERRDG